jgi:hypothetical protein
MLHLIVGLIGTILFFALFGEFIIGIVLLIVGGLLVALLSWLIGLYTAQFTIIGLGVILLAVVLLLFDKVKNIIPRSIRLTKANNGQKPKVGGNSANTPDFKKYPLGGSTDEFRSKYPFVVFEVPVESRERFISECLWLQKRTGLFPSEPDQYSILSSIEKDHGTDFKHSPSSDDSRYH